MKVSDKLIQLLEEFEEFEASPYLCPAGIPTIGYGFTYYPDTKKKVTLQDPPITKERAEEILRTLLEQYELLVDAATVDTISQHQFDALVSFTYNVGIEAYKKSTLRKLVNANPDDLNIANEFRRWNKVKGRAVKGLTLRREKELKYYFS